MRTHSVSYLLITVWLLCLAIPSVSVAKLSEPDFVIWGTITLNDQPVTANQTDVFLTAQRGEAGPVLATYRMGDEPAAGDRYLLRIPMESLDPLFDPLTAIIGGPIVVTVSNLSGTLQTVTRTPADRGDIQRYNFNIGGTGGDNNGLPDDWEIQYFGGNGQDPDDDPDGDGKSTREEFDLGTDPTDADDVLTLGISTLANTPRVAFFARAAAGPGYQGATRFYTIEATANPGTDAWSPLPGYTDILGNDRPIVYEPPQSDSRLFFRLRVTLQR